MITPTGALNRAGQIDPAGGAVALAPLDPMTRRAIALGIGMVLLMLALVAVFGKKSAIDAAAGTVAGAVT